MDCYLELSHFSEPVLESKKVQDLLARIKAPELAAMKQQVKAMANLSYNFEEAVNFLSLSVVPLKPINQQIAAIGTRVGELITLVAVAEVKAEAEEIKARIEVAVSVDPIREDMVEVVVEDAIYE